MFTLTSAPKGLCHNQQENAPLLPQLVLPFLSEKSQLAFTIQAVCNFQCASFLTLPPFLPGKSCLHFPRVSSVPLSMYLVILQLLYLVLPTLATLL